MILEVFSEQPDGFRIRIVLLFVALSLEWQEEKWR